MGVGRCSHDADRPGAADEGGNCVSLRRLSVATLAGEASRRHGTRDPSGRVAMPRRGNGRDRSLQRLQSAFELAPMAVGVTRGERLLFQTANPALRKMLSDTQFEGSEVEAMLRQVMLDGENLERTVALPVRAPTGTATQVRHYRASAVRLSRSDGPADEVLFFAFDITAQIEALRKSEQQVA